MFEYIFYRLYLSYKKHEPNTNHGFHASFTISVLHFSMVACVMIVLNGCFDIFDLPKDSILGKIITLGFMALLVFFNYKHYTPKIKEMEKRFAKRPANKWLKDWLFFLLLILTFLSFIFGPFIVSNLLS